LMSPKQRMGKKTFDLTFYRLVALQKHLKVIKNLKADNYELPFDVILLDLDMPILNGFETCLKLRQGEGSGGGQDLQQIFRIETKAKLINAGGGDTSILGDINERLLIIAVSALITDSIVEKIKKCGFDDYST